MNNWGSRVLFFIFVLISVLVLPWWVTFPIVAILTIYLPLYLEALFFGLFFDTLYSAHFAFPFFGLSVAFIFLMLVTSFRPLIRT